MYKFFLCFILIIILGCNHNTDNNYIKTHQWKYGKGDGSIDDWLSFEGNIYKIMNDTLYKYDTARAIIISLDTNDNNHDVELKIKSLKDGETAIYHEKK